MKEKLLELVETWRGFPARGKEMSTFCRCAAELEEIALSIPDQSPVTREQVLAVLSEMQSVMCGAALNGREQTADAIMALLNPPHQDMGVARERVREILGRNVKISWLGQGAPFLVVGNAVEEIVALFGVGGAK